MSVHRILLLLLSLGWDEPNRGWTIIRSQLRVRPGSSRVRPRARLLLGRPAAAAEGRCGDVKLKARVDGRGAVASEGTGRSEAPANGLFLCAESKWDGRSERAGSEVAPDMARVGVVCNKVYAGTGS